MNKTGMLIVALIGMGASLSSHHSFASSAMPTRKDITAIFNELGELTDVFSPEERPTITEECTTPAKECPTTTDKSPSDQAPLIALINRGFAEDDLITFPMLAKGFKQADVSFNHPQNSLSFAMRNAYFTLLRISSLMREGARSGQHKQKHLTRINTMLHFLNRIKDNIENQYD